MTTLRSGSGGAGHSPMAVVDDREVAGAYVFAGGLELDGPVFSADATSGTFMFTDGPYVETKEWLGGLTVVDVADEETARMWAGKIAEACGWPQEVRRFGSSRGQLAQPKSEWEGRSQLQKPTCARVQEPQRVLQPRPQRPHLPGWRRSYPKRRPLAIRTNRSGLDRSRGQSLA